MPFTRCFIAIYIVYAHVSASHDAANMFRACVHAQCVRCNIYRPCLPATACDMLFFTHYDECACAKDAHARKEPDAMLMLMLYAMLPRRVTTPADERQARRHDMRLFFSLFFAYYLLFTQRGAVRQPRGVMYAAALARLPRASCAIFLLSLLIRCCLLPLPPRC